MPEPLDPFERAAEHDGLYIEYRLYAVAVRRARSLGAPVAPRYLPGSPGGCNGSEAALAIRRTAAERGPNAPLLTYLATQTENLAADLACALEELAADRRERGMER